MATWRTDSSSSFVSWRSTPLGDTNHAHWRRMKGVLGACKRTQRLQRRAAESADRLRNQGTTSAVHTTYTPPYEARTSQAKQPSEQPTRNHAEAPMRRLSVGLLDTYKGINQTYYETQRKRRAEETQRAEDEAAAEQRRRAEETQRAAAEEEERAMEVEGQATSASHAAASTSESKRRGSVNNGERRLSG